MGSRAVVRDGLFVVPGFLAPDTPEGREWVGFQARYRYGDPEWRKFSRDPDYQRGGFGYPRQPSVMHPIGAARVVDGGWKRWDGKEWVGAVRPSFAGFGIGGFVGGGGGLGGAGLGGRGGLAGDVIPFPGVRFAAPRGAGSGVGVGETSHPADQDRPRGPERMTRKRNYTHANRGWEDEIRLHDRVARIEYHGENTRWPFSVAFGRYEVSTTGLGNEKRWIEEWRSAVYPRSYAVFKTEAGAVKAATAWVTAR